MVAQLLHGCGLFLGDDLVPAQRSNRYGHFEDWDVVRLHDGILLDNGYRWEVARPFLPVIGASRWRELQHLVAQRQLEHAVWGFKDPRVCLFLEIWRYLLPNARFLIVFRNFADSSYSLERRAADELFAERGPVEQHRRFWEEPDLAVRIWLAHNEPLVRFAHRHPHLTFTVSDERVRAGLPLARLLNDRWGLGLDETAGFEGLDPQASSERPGRQPVSDPRLPERLESTLDDLLELERITLSGTGSPESSEVPVAG